MNVCKARNEKKLSMNACWKLENSSPLTRDVLFWKKLPTTSNNCTLLTDFWLRSHAMFSWSSQKIGFLALPGR